MQRVWRFLADSVAEVRPHAADAKLATSFPTERWRWRRAWDGRPIFDTTKQHFVFLVLGAVVFSAAAALMLRQRIVERREDLPWWAVGICAVGAVVLIGVVGQRLWAVYRCGVASFVPSVVPGSVGGYVAGWIHFPSAAPGDGRASVTLRCLRTETFDDGGKDGTSSSTQTTLWSEARQARVHADVDCTLVPVLFQVPESCPESDGRAPRTKTSWELAIEIPVAGSAFSARFEVPVFRTGNTSAPPDLADLHDEEESEGDADRAAVAGAGLRVFNGVRGLEIEVPPATPLVMRIALPLGAIGCAIAAEVRHEPLWWLGAMIVGGIAAENVFDSTKLLVNRSGVDLRRLRPWGFRTTRHAWSDLGQCQAAAIAASDGEFLRVSLPTLGRDGPGEITLAKLMKGRPAAEALCRIVESHRPADATRHAQTSAL